MSEVRSCELQVSHEATFLYEKLSPPPPPLQQIEGDTIFSRRTVVVVFASGHSTSLTMQTIAWIVEPW